MTDPAPDSFVNLSPPERLTLRRTACASIEHGVRFAVPLRVNADDYVDALREPGATFVTLTVDEQLAGCIGSLVARRPLIEDVAHNAFAAAFRDERFPAMTSVMMPRLKVEIAILSPMERLICPTEADLCRRLRPGIDGLALREGECRGTFLPAVWESIEDPVDFVRRLKGKAGIDPGSWSDQIVVERYRVEKIT